MKIKLSIISLIIVSITLIQYRISYTDIQNGKPLKVTTWDAFGYYMYLPGTFIYNDVTELEWLNGIDEEYELTGGVLYQANKHDNGNYVFKYLGGVAVLQSPFFFIGHVIAINSNYKADGFSPPYQYSIAFGAILYCILALFLLRNLLLNYFSDSVVALTILLLVLATNLIQYVSIDSGQSHAYIFFLYVLLLYATMKWHNKPKLFWAGLIGLVIGLATICRPTEAIMIFIPILWGSQTKESRIKKWELVRGYKTQILVTILFGIIGIMPQLIYWKIASGSFIYDVGSKWFFLNPWFRVLFGFENGWFIYTPITILFVLGLFFIKSFPFRKSVIVFCLLNIWIIIAWSDWKYGATYSTRAMVQSYPVFALAFAAIIERIISTKWKYVFFLVGLYLIFVNLFQIGQYGETVLHYRDMNRKYYSAIYLNSNPTPLDMSLLDTDEIFNGANNQVSETIFKQVNEADISSRHDSVGYFLQLPIDLKNKDDSWLKIKANINSEVGFSDSYLHCKIESKEILKENKIRLFNPISSQSRDNNYEFDFKVPNHSKELILKLYIVTTNEFKGKINRFSVDLLVE